MARSPFRRLLGPGPDEVDAQGLAAHLRGREVLALNMVVSLDGRAAVAGRSQPLSGPADRELFWALRAAADCVLVGAGTVRHERYGPLSKDPRARRPLAAVVSRSGELPADLPLLADPAQETVVLDGADLRADVERLRAREARSILCEGGPTLNAALLRAAVVDELLVTLAPRLAGGEDPLTMIIGDLDATRTLAPLTLHERDGAVFARYAVTGRG